MSSLDAIKSACLHAIESQDEDPHWKQAYLAVADPQTVFALTERIETADRIISGEELRALAKLVRDMSGYIKLSIGDKSDPVRDDLLLHARQLLGLMGL